MQKHVELTYNGITLRGMFHHPEGNSGKYPGVILFHGFTGNKMESHFLFVKLSRALEKVGIASVRFDFYGSGESDGSFQEMTPDTEIKDGKAILEYMKSIDIIDNRRIGICGLSMGGYIAGIIAGDCKNDVKALCLMAPAGNIKEIFEANMTEQNRAGKNLYDIGGFLLNASARDSAANIDHIKRTSMFDKKVCIIHGTNDQSVPYNIGLQYKNAMRQTEFYPIEGSNHTFNSIEWENKVIDIVTGFFIREL